MRNYLNLTIHNPASGSLIWSKNTELFLVSDPELRACRCWNQTLTWTYVARAKNKDMNTLQTRQITESHDSDFFSLQTSPIAVADLSLPRPAKRDVTVYENRRFSGYVHQWGLVWYYLRLLPVSLTRSHLKPELFNYLIRIDGWSIDVYHFGSVYFTDVFFPDCSVQQNERSSARPQWRQGSHKTVRRLPINLYKIKWVTVNLSSSVNCL